jgi:hypothetical protein
MNRTRGGAVVELVLWMGIFTVTLAASLDVSRVVFWRLRLVSAARLAATLAGSGRVEPATIDHELKMYFQQFPGAHAPAPDFSLTRFLGVPSAPFYQLMSVRLRLALPLGTLDEVVRVQQEDVS